MIKIKEYQELASKVKVDGLRDCRSMMIGQVVRQGDIYIHRVKNTHSHGELTNNHQLAMGITLGSRHIADENFKVYKGTTLPEWVNPGHFLGPCIVTDSDTALITHPEHSNVALSKGTYQIQHQLDIRTMKRVQD